jgi:mRNA-degrading endonuclease RelE of RelBE toxin-antitoxin system
VRKAALSRRAARELAKVRRWDRALCARLVAAMRSAAAEPAAGARLAGEWGGLRALRVGGCRLVYEPFRSRVVFLELGLGPRRALYR